jgi:hypothetical protein
MAPSESVSCRITAFILHEYPTRHVAHMNALRDEIRAPLITTLSRFCFPATLLIAIASTVRGCRATKGQSAGSGPSARRAIVRTRHSGL